MRIKVEYAKTNLEKALWSVKRKFTTEEFEPIAYPVRVRGLKPAIAESDIDWDSEMDCEKQTGLTEEQYQAKHGIAWNA